MVKYGEIPEEPTVSGRFEKVILQDDTQKKVFNAEANNLCHMMVK